jgi:hypothetical protein
MAVIDIGPGAITRSSTVTLGNTTNIDKANPSNDTGVLDSFEIYAKTNLAGVIIGTFSGSGTSYDDRDYESIGTVTGGSKQTFTGKNCDVVTGDFLGIYGTGTGAIYYYISGGSDIYSTSGNMFGSGSQTYTRLSGDVISIYATGATVAAGNPYYYYLQQ